MNEKNENIIEYKNIIDENNIDENNNTTNNQSSLNNKIENFNLINYTNQFDNLYIKNKKLEKKLEESKKIIHELETKLADNTIKISKNLFYLFLIGTFYLLWTLGSNIIKVNETLIETNYILNEYKKEIEKLKMYNKNIFETKSKKDS